MVLEKQGSHSVLDRSLRQAYLLLLLKSHLKINIVTVTASFKGLRSLSFRFISRAADIMWSVPALYPCPIPVPLILNVPLYGFPSDTGKSGTGVKITISAVGFLYN